MHLNNIRIKNYKGFKDQVSFEIKPITLIYGENNSGKSSIARLLPSIKKSCLQKTPGVPFYPVEIHKSLPSSDFIYGNSRSFEISLDFNELKVRYSISKIDNGLKVDKLIIESKKNGKFEIEWDIVKENSYKILETDDFIQLNFKGLIPYLCADLLEKPINNALIELKIYLEKLMPSIYWIAPIRYVPEPIEKLALAQSKMSPDGLEATQILARSYLDDSLVFNTVNEWFNNVFKQELIIKKTGLSRYEMFSVELSSLGNKENVSVPLVNCGTGISQVLPIIVLAAQALHGKLGENPFLVFENPELHLHDSIHCAVGEFLAEIVTKSESQPYVIIETHSENLLLSFQIQIAKKKININKDNLIINWLKKEDGINLIDKVTINENGMLSDKWPLDAFQTTSKLARELFNTVYEEGVK